MTACIYALACILCLLSTSTKASPYPGVAVRLSQPGLNYAAQRAIVLLENYLKENTALPDVEEQSGKTTYSLRNMRVTSFTAPQATVTVNPGTGVGLSLTGAGITVEGDFSYSHKLWFVKIRDSGRFTLTLSEVSLSVQVDMGISNEGKPTITVLDCSSSVGKAKLKFSKTFWSWLYNLIANLAERKIKSKIADAMCTQIRRVIEENGNRELANLKTTVTILNKVTVDYSLLTKPSFGQNYIESGHKAQFTWIADGQMTPLQLVPMQLPSTGSQSMASLYLSQFVIQSLGYIMYTHGILSYSFTKRDLPSNTRYALDMTCETVCLGLIFPKAASKYPDSSGELITRVVESPSVVISGGTILINFDAEIKIVVRQPDGGELPLVIISFNASVNGSAYIANDKIYGRVNKVISEITGLSVISPDEVGTLPDDYMKRLNDVVKIFTELYATPQLNYLAGIGLELPKLRDISFVNPQLRLGEGIIIVETDAAY